MMHLPNIEIALEGEMNKLPKKPRNEEMYKAILTLKSLDECMRFFDDLCTVTELMAMEQRYQVASCLDKGMIYNDILAETGASSATISRVNRSLQYGRGGYAIVFDRMKEQDE
jgi:TrpR-related protein YerC/YecD